MSNAFAASIVLARGNTEPMDAETVQRLVLPIGMTIADIKKSKAESLQVYESMEFFTVCFGAGSLALDEQVGDGRELIKARCEVLSIAARIVRDLHKAMHGGESATCSLEQLAALDAGLIAGIELHEVLPEWCFMTAGYQIMKHQNRSRPKRKTVRKKRVRRRNK